jgi:GxxExxY protein
MAVNGRERLLLAPMTDLIQGDRTESCIGAFYEVYNTLGTRLLEKAYTGALEYELELRGHKVRREVPTDIWCKSRAVARYKTDLVVDERVVIEVKSTDHLNREDHRQVLNYLRATRWEVGLLLHFGPKPSFYRFVSSNDDPLKYGGRGGSNLGHSRDGKGRTPE